MFGDTIPLAASCTTADENDEWHSSKDFDIKIVHGKDTIVQPGRGVAVKRAVHTILKHRKDRETEDSVLKYDANMALNGEMYRNMCRKGMERPS